MTDIASLGLKVESSQVQQGRTKLDELTASSERAEQSQEDLGAATTETGKKFEGLSRSARTAIENLGGLGPRARAIMNAMSAAPFALTGAAVAAGVLGKAYVQGSIEATNFARALIHSNGVVGVTVAQLTAMAERMDDLSGTQAEASRTLGTFAASGAVGAESLERFAAVAQRIKSTIGTPIEETAQAFTDLAEEPTKSAAKLQKSFNFLTPAVYSYIAAQEKAGNIAGAAAAAQDAYAGAYERALKNFEQSVPFVVRSWESIKKVASETWDEMLGVGRTKSAEKRLAELVDSLPGSTRPGTINSVGEMFTGDMRRTAAAQEQIQILRTQIEVENKAAEAKRRDAEQTKAYIEQQEEFAKRADEFADAQKRINAAWTAFDVSAINRNLSGVVGRYEAAQDELDALRGASLISDKDYFEQRRNLLQQSANAEISALRQVNATLTRQDDLSATERIAAQNKIAENAQRIADIQIRTASQLEMLGIQQRKDLRDTATAYEEAQASADRYVQTLIKRYQIESQGLGLGERERQRLRERAELESRFEDRRQDLDRDKRRGDIDEKEYARLLKIEEEALKKSEAAFDKHYEKLLRKQGDWRVGASEAFRNFMDEAANVAGQVESLMTRAFDGALDAVVEFAMTGKNSFGDLAKSILADLLKIELKVQLSNVLGPIFGGVMSGIPGFGGGTINTPGGGFGGGMPFGGGRATGGSVWPGSSFDVGENGRERFFPTTAGIVMPNSSVGGGVSIHQVIHVGSNTDRAEQARFFERNNRELVQQVKNAQNRER